MTIRPFWACIGDSRSTTMLSSGCPLSWELPPVQLTQSPGFPPRAGLPLLTPSPLATVSISVCHSWNPGQWRDRDGRGYLVGQCPCIAVRARSSDMPAAPPSAGLFFSGCLRAAPGHSKHLPGLTTGTSGNG